MKSSCFYKIVILFFICVVCNPLQAEDVFFKVGFHAYKLDNGLELYVQEDFSSALVYMNYVSKAGVASQSPETVGFFKLYSKLFWQNTDVSLQDFVDCGCSDFSSNCYADCSMYSFSMPLLAWQTALDLFSKNIQVPSFSSSIILKETEALYNDMVSFSTSSSGFINSAIDARIFSRSPWKHASGVFPQVFDGLKSADCAMRLQLITDLYYTPNNSALFVSGPVDAEVVQQKVNNLFFSWKKGIYSKSSEGTYHGISALSENRRFVLVSDKFSNSMNQLVVQYTAPGLFADLSFSARAYVLAKFLGNGTNSSDGTDGFKKEVIADNKTGVLEEDYVNTAFSQDGEYSRVIIQSLMKNNASPVQQVKHILSTLNESVQQLSDDELSQIKKISLASMKESQSSSAFFMDSLASSWAYGGISYKTYFSDKLAALTLDDVKSVSNENPWLFLVIHTETYNKYKNELDLAGYTAISSYANTQYIKKLYAPYQGKGVQESVTSNLNEQSEEKTVSLWVKNNLLNVYQIELSNRIPVCVKKIIGATTASMILSFTGSKKGIVQNVDTVVIKALTKLLDAHFSAMYTAGQINTIPSTFSWSSLLNSSIQINCLAEDTNSILKSIASVLVYGSITPSLADECVYTQLNEMRTKSQSLQYQLYSGAMQAFCDDNVVANYFKIDSDALQQISFEQISQCYTDFLDASRLTLVVAGNVDTEFVKIAQQNFGVLRNFSKLNKSQSEVRDVSVVDLPPLHVPNMAQNIRLHHTFLTDIPAELAGPAPEKLIPTSDFSDPAQLYFELPTLSIADFVVYRAMLELLADTLNFELRSMRNPPAESVTACFSTDTSLYSCLRFNKVHSRSQLQKLTEKYLTQFELAFTTKMMHDAKVKSSAYDFSDTASISGTARLMDSSLQLYGQASAFITNYATLTSATLEDFVALCHCFSATYSRTWLFSSDTES